MLEAANMKPMSVAELSDRIRVIEDFPKPGISFKDITPLLADPRAFNELVAHMSHAIKESGAEAVVGLEARGFIVGIAIAHHLGLPFIPARKPGKLPADTVSIEYDLEYGQAALEIHKDVVRPGSKVAVVDDLLATGGTAQAACELVERMGAEIAGCFFAIELKGLQGRDRLGEHRVESILMFD